VPAPFDRALRQAIDAAAATVPGVELRRAVEALSQRYRASAGGTDTEPGPGPGAAIAAMGRLTAAERIAYTVVRLPATAAVLDVVFDAVERHTCVVPQTILDLGAGPATVLWPALSRWPGVRRVTLLDRDPEFLRLGLRIYQAGRRPGVGPASARPTPGLPPASAHPTPDLLPPSAGARPGHHGPSSDGDSAADAGEGASPGPVPASSQHWPGRLPALPRPGPGLRPASARPGPDADPAGAGLGPEIQVRTGDLAAADVMAADLVVLSYAINELTEAQAARAIDRALGLATGALVVVEPGTPAGFARIRAVRDRLRAAGATIAAPCPHADACPMAGADWCHFAVRLDRSRAHRQSKQAALGWEDEKFAYVVATRDPAALSDRAEARVLRRPRKETGHVRLSLCAPGGLTETVVRRRDPDYRAARDASWGDAWPTGASATARLDDDPIA
jgi:ribosomal protein RSM22 (predicted rRNA methylase)